MTRSPLVFAAAGGGTSAVPGCVEDPTTRWSTGYGWCTPLPLLTGAGGNGVGSR